MKKKNKLMKNLKLFVMAFIAIFTFVSCRPAALRKGVQIVEKVAKSAEKSAYKGGELIKVSGEAAQKARNLSGKEIKLSEKATFILRYSDDVMRHLDFQKKSCPSCHCSGRDSYGNTCSRCDGDGYVYKLEYK